MKGTIPQLCVFESISEEMCRCVACGRELQKPVAGCHRIYIVCGTRPGKILKLRTRQPIDPSRPRKATPRVTAGPGTELKQLLKKFFITSKNGCGCDQRAAIMDEQGCDWCEEHIGVIVAWMKEEAKLRRLPFVSLGAAILVRRAIRNARHQEATRK